jgi:arylsulfatase A-like enzyme
VIQIDSAYRCLLIATLIVALAGCAGGVPQTVDKPRPNIVYIMADDLGYGDLSGYGRSDYSTPNLDKLAAEGTRFTQAYAIAPVCTPTRVGLMTGQYPAKHRAGLWEPLRTQFREEGLDPAKSALARRLREAGYHTGLVGKWHLGWNPGLWPNDHGFHQWFATMSGGADYILHRSSEPGDPSGSHDLYQDGTEIRTEGYLTDIFTDQAEAFLRSAPQPFFLNLEYTAPHWPWQQRGDAPYPDDKDPSTYGGSPATYAGMMQALDEGVARVLAVLKEKGYADNTIVIFHLRQRWREVLQHGWPPGDEAPVMGRWHPRSRICAMARSDSGRPHHRSGCLHIGLDRHDACGGRCCNRA